MSHAPPRRLLRLWAPSANRFTRSCCQEVHEAGRASPAPSLGRQRRTCRPTCRRSSCHPTLGPAQRDNGRLGLLSKPHPAPRSSGAAARRCDSGATRGREGARQPLRAAPRAARSGCGAKRGRRRAREVTCACVVRARMQDMKCVDGCCLLPGQSIFGTYLTHNKRVRSAAGGGRRARLRTWDAAVRVPLSGAPARGLRAQCAARTRARGARAPALPGCSWGYCRAGGAGRGARGVPCAVHRYMWEGISDATASWSARRVRRSVQPCRPDSLCPPDRGQPRRRHKTGCSSPRASPARLTARCDGSDPDPFEC